MAPDVRGYLGRAAAFSGQNPQTGYHGLVFANGKHLVRRTFLFIVPPVPLDQFDGDRKQLHHIGHAGFYTVAHQPCTALGIRMDILVRDLLQIRIRQTCEAHEQEHVTDSPLALVIQLDMDDALQVLLGEERTPLVFGQAVETDERVKPYPASFLGGIHQPFQGVDPAESRRVRQGACPEHPVIIVLDELLVKVGDGYILDAPLLFEEKQQILVVGHQPAIGACRLFLAYLFLVGGKLLPEQSHKGVIIVPETKIAVVDTFSCHQAVMVADILVMPCDLGLDIVKLLVQPSGLVGFPFRPLGLGIP